MPRDRSETRGLHAFFSDQPEEAHRQFFDRDPGVSRRGFFAGAGLAAGGLIGMAIPFYGNMPRGLVPAAFADSDVLVGKDGLTLLNDRPINAETPAHLLDDHVTPTERHFIRNNGLPPESVDEAGWTLTIDGLVDNPMTLSIADLRRDFDVVTMQLVIECGGNGRAFFNPPARGNQWTYGAVACSEWTGVRLADVLKRAGVKPNVVYTAHYGADTHLSGKPGKLPISRGVPIAKAMTDSVLIAFAMNGGALHRQNGAPLRLVVPGWPGSCSQKWLTRIQLRDQVHDGPKMTGTAYRVPRYRVAPGAKVPEADFEIIERMPVKSLITMPANNSEVKARKTWAGGPEKIAKVRGHAWSGDRTIGAVQLSVDYGMSWIQADILGQERNPGAWVSWVGYPEFPEPGYYEIWARATDSAGDSQPFAVRWNPKGYLNNTVHRVGVQIV